MIFFGAKFEFDFRNKFSMRKGKDLQIKNGDVPVNALILCLPSVSLIVIPIK